MGFPGSPSRTGLDRVKRKSVLCCVKLIFFGDNGDSVIEVTDVTIRGIEDETYSEFSAEARRQNKSIGEITTEAMRSYLEKLYPAKEKIHTISYVEELRLSKLDLEEFAKPIVLSYIEHLIVEDDVDLDTFERYISRIEYCEHIEVPRHFPKLYTYSKCRHCERVTRIE